MVFEDAVLLVMASVLSILALIVSFFVGSEVVNLVREFARNLGEPHRPRPEAESVPLAPPAKSRNRATVERLITHFQEDRDTARVDE